MKYFKIKHIALLLAVTSAPLYTACDFMDCSETDYYSKQQILDNMDRVKQLATQVDSYLPHDFCNTSGAMQDAATDDAIHVYESSAIQRFVNGTWSANYTVNDVFGTYYNAIHDANFYLENCVGLTFDEWKYSDGFADDYKSYLNYEHEVRFLRAFYYFELVKRYQNIPLITKTLTQEEANEAEPSDAVTILNFIISECTDLANDKLPVNYNNMPGGEGNLQRATKGMALALKSRASLYLASPLYSPDDTQKWKNAAQAAGKNKKKVVKSGEKTVNKATENGKKGLGSTKPEKKKKPVGSEFYNTLACLVGDYFMKCGATLYPCDLRTKDAYANMDIAGYNYGIFRYKHDLKKYPNRLILGSETFCKDAYSFWEIAKKNKRIIGDFVWAGWDYIGEVGDGAAEYSDYKFEDPATRMTGGNGRIDLNGKPRAEAAYTRVAFERETGPFIAVDPVYQKEKLRLTGWQLTKALESWAWDGCNGEPAKVEVYARAAQVELFINGKSAGKKKVKKCRANFNITYQNGEITAVSYDENGREINRYSLHTAGKETVLQVRPEEKTVKPEGLAFIQLQYTDSKGIWKPMEKHNIKVTVENGVLKGLGSPAPYVKGNYTDHTVATYYGEAMAVVQADGNGSVKVTVADEEQFYVVEIPCE